MTDDPVHLDAHRGTAARRATELRRRRLREYQADRAALHRRQDQLETMILSAPADNWPEAAARAQYLIELFAATQDAQSPRRRELIANTLADLDRLCDRETDQP